MSKREDQAFEVWAEEFKASLANDEAREAFDLMVAGDPDNARELYRGTLRTDDYYTKLNKLNDDQKKLEGETQELKAAQDELAEWWDKEEPMREAIIKERDELRKKLTSPPGDDTNSDVGDNPPSSLGGISPEDLALLKSRAAKVDAMDKLLPQVLGEYGRALQDAWDNEYDVDPREIMQVSSKQGIDPYRAMLSLTEKQREEREKNQLEEQKKKWFEEGRQAALSGQAPDHIQSSGPSMFDILSESNKVSETTNPATAPASGARVGEALRQFREGDF